MAGGTINRKDLITDDALNYGVELSKNIDTAIKAQENLLSSAKEFSKLASQFKTSTSQKDFIQLTKDQEKATQEAAKAQIQLQKAEQAAIQTKIKLRQEQEARRKAVERSTEAEQKGLRSLNNTKKSEIQLSEAQRRQREAIQRSSERTKRAIEKENSAFNRLTKDRDKARKIVQDYNAQVLKGIKLSNTQQKEFKDTRRELVRLDKQVNKIIVSTNQFSNNFSRYPKIFSSVTGAIKTFIGTLGLIEGIRFFSDFTKDAFSLSNAAKGVEFAFKDLGSAGASAFEDVKDSTRGLLSDLDIKTSLVEFDNFNISLKDSGTLFEFLALRATQTGKSIDSLRDSLVEGLSKESLLRIDNLGISTARLKEEMSKTADFTEAVANIARVEISKAGSILDEASNSQALWTSTIENTKLEFGRLVNTIISGDGLVSKTLINLIEGFGILSSSVRGLISSDEDFINEEATKAAERNLKRIIDIAKESGETIEEVFKRDIRIEVATENIEKAKKEIEELNKKINDPKEVGKAVNKKLKEQAEELVKITEKELKLTDELVKKELILSSQKKFIADQEENKKNNEARLKAIDLEKFRLQETIKSKKIDLELEKFTANEKLKILADLTDAQIKLTELNSRTEIKDKQLKGESLFVLEKSTASEILKIKEDSVKKAIEIRNKEFQNEIDNIKKFAEEQKNKENTEIISIQTEAQDTGTAEAIEQSERDITALKLKNQEIVFKKQIEYLEKILTATKLTAEQEAIVNTELAKLKLDLSNNTTALILSNLNKEQEKEQGRLDELNEQFSNIKNSVESFSGVLSGALGGINTQPINDIFNGLQDVFNEGEKGFSKFAEIANSSFELVGEIANARFQQRIQEIDLEIEKNNERFDILKEKAEGDEELQNELEKTREKKEKKLKKEREKEQIKEFNNQKAFKAIDIIGNTAVAISKAVAASPTTGGLPFSAIAAALGAVQLGVVLSQKPPKFKDGVKGFEGGLAVLGDGGVPEIITDSKDRILGVSPAHDTLYNLPSGSNVYSSKDDYLANLYKDIDKAAIITSLKNDSNNLSIKELGNSFDRNFENLEGSIKKGINKGFRNIKFEVNNNFADNDRTEYLNKQMS